VQISTHQAKKTLEDIEARHNDIVKLESSIRELHEMFIDVAALVESQVDKTTVVWLDCNTSAKNTLTPLAETDLYSDRHCAVTLNQHPGGL